MTKFVYIIFFYSSFFLSQVNITIKFIDKKSNVDESKFLEIKIKNNSDKSYAIPLDTLDFKPFYQDEICTNFSDPESYRDLMLKTYFKNESDSESLIAIPYFKLTGKIDESDKNIVKEMTKRDSLFQLQKKEINNWTKKNKINKNSVWAIKNKFLYTNILFLKPKQEFIYYKSFNPKHLNFDNITGNYDSYNLILNERYLFSLKFCVENSIYQYLTKQQEKKLKGYVLFSGNLESNVLKWE